MKKIILAFGLLLFTHSHTYATTVEEYVPKAVYKLEDLYSPSQTLGFVLNKYAIAMLGDYRFERRYQKAYPQGKLVDLGNLNLTQFEDRKKLMRALGVMLSNDNELPDMYSLTENLIKGLILIHIHFFKNEVPPLYRHDNNFLIDSIAELMVTLIKDRSEAKTYIREKMYQQSSESNLNTFLVPFVKTTLDGAFPDVSAQDKQIIDLIVSKTRDRVQLKMYELK